MFRGRAGRGVKGRNSVDDFILVVILLIFLPRMEVEIGKEVLRKSTEYVNRGMSNIGLKYFREYFNIDDAFVLKKIFLILFPFNNINWSGDVGNGNGLLRRELYIPLMGMISYILLRAFYIGLNGRFSPEEFGLMFTRLVFLELVCTVFVKVSGYFIDVNLRVLDVLSYCGYKYVVILLLYLCKQRYLRIISSLYLYTCLFFFLSRNLKKQVIGTTPGDKSKRIYYLFCMVLAQVFIAFLFS